MNYQEIIPKNPHSEHPLGSQVIDVIGALLLVGGLFLVFTSERAGSSVATAGAWALVLGGLGTIASLLKRGCWELRKIHNLLQKQTDHLCGEGEPPVKE